MSPERPLWGSSKEYVHTVAKRQIVSKHIKEDFATLTVHFLQLGQKMYNFDRNFAWKTTNLKYAGKIIEPGYTYTIHVDRN